MGFRRVNVRVSALAQMAGMAAVDIQFEPSLCRGEQALLKQARRSKNRSKVTIAGVKSVNTPEKPLDLRRNRSDRQSEYDP